MLYNIYSRIDNAEVRLPNGPGSRIFHPLPKRSILTAEQSPQADFCFPIPLNPEGSAADFARRRRMECVTLQCHIPFCGARILAERFLL